MFWRIAKTISLLVLVCMTGCASLAQPPKIKLSSPFKKLGAGSSSAEKQDEDVEETEAVPKRQPLIARNRSFAPQRSPHDAQTQQQIEAELADATPAERAEWMDYLATVDSAMVPYALQSRRIQAGTEPPQDPVQQERQQRSDSPYETDSKIVNTGHSIQSDSRERSAAETLDQAPIHGAGIQTAKHESVEEIPEAETHPSGDWSGKLKSLTEWERNPLKFGREIQGEREVERKDRRGNPLPQIITNPFHRGTGANAPSTAESLAARETSVVEDTPPKRLSPENLRIAPGSKLWEEELHKLVSLMEAEAAASGYAMSGAVSRSDLRQQVALRMLYLINDQSELAMQPISGLQPEDQEFWTSIFWALSNHLSREKIEPAERSTRTIEQLRSATHYLQVAAKLDLRNVCFCKAIHGFGNFEQFESAEFHPGQPLLIYSDVRNFQSEASEQGFFVTRLRSTIEIFDGDLSGQPIDRSSFPASEDRCSTMRTDYYNSYRIELPVQLNSGPHMLRLTVYDELSGKSATETLHFTVR